jgi:ATP-dependent DNA helicase RecG
MSDTYILEDAHMRSTDSQPIRSASLADIDIERVSDHIAQATARGRYNGTRDPLDYLKRQRCVAVFDDELHATPAGILCFGRNPQEIFPQAVVDIGHYSGGESISYEALHIEKGVAGSLFEQIDRVEAFLWANTLHGMTIGDGARRVEIHEYPRVVLRELVVNMVVHRDYTNQHSTARVQKLRDRIEWISPGGLPPGVTIDNLLVAQSSRNPVIARVLYEIGLVEAFGQGLDTVVRELQRGEMQTARFDDLGGFFQVTVWGKPMSRFAEIASVTRLSDRQRRILSFIRARGWSTPRDIAGLFESHITQRSIQRDLKDLIEAELVIQDGKGRAVRYQVQE